MTSARPTPRPGGALVLLLVASGWLLGCRSVASTPASAPPEPAASPTGLPEVPASPPTADPTAGPRPPAGPGTPPASLPTPPAAVPGLIGPPVSGGPFNDQTYLATSADGLRWSEGTLLAEHASVPEVLRTSAGVIWAYWVDFSGAAGPRPERIGVARSPDGVSWELLGTVAFAELGSRVPVDPDVVELPDGRLRMYFFDIAGGPGANTIYSALSSDGLNFALEPGARFSLAGVLDPSVVRLPDGRYRMFLNRGDILSATSPDGLQFTLDDGIRVERGAVPGAIVLPDGTLRLYACVAGISVFRSSDGLTFSLEQRGVVEPQPAGGVVCDPSVTALSEGYLMAYKVGRGQGPPGPTPAAP